MGDIATINLYTTDKYSKNYVKQINKIKGRNRKLTKIFGGQLE